MPDSRANYPIFQAHLSQENVNLNQRLFWYLFSQSLLLGAYSSAINAPEKAHSPAFAAQQELMVWVLPLTSIALSAVLYPMIVISIRHMAGLREQFAAQAVGLDDLPPIHGQPGLRRVGDIAYLTLPLVTSAAWIVLLVRSML